MPKIIKPNTDTPSFIANYPGVGIEAMARALKKLGFAGVEETAIGGRRRLDVLQGEGLPRIC